ncbi:hypothetical protein BJY52DRAFT_1417925 [Lactarius psammicola]|nr:hypothetical protein BJY52DRAFT_1417925 [Lactarius psammicola]
MAPPTPHLDLPPYMRLHRRTNRAPRTPCTSNGREMDAAAFSVAFFTLATCPTVRPTLILDSPSVYADSREWLWPLVPMDEQEQKVEVKNETEGGGGGEHASAALLRLEAVWNAVTRLLARVGALLGAVDEVPCLRYPMCFTFPTVLTLHRFTPMT